MSSTSQTANLNRPGCRLLFGLFWIAFSSIFLVIGLTQEDNTFAIFGLIFVLIGVGLLLFGLLSYYSRFRIGQPEITISEKMLRVGENFSVSVSHQFKRSVQIETIQLELQFRETAVYQRGTDTTTVVHNHSIALFEEPGGQFQAGHIIQKNYDLQIPVLAMHSLKVRRNKLEWFVRFVVSVPRLPDLIEEIELEVVPVLAR
jgi:hypothetical protein